ncbi:hypothetical protein MPL3356_40520 [Mesorhizobium plurifarium]|uniref:Uncharacterized protein n=1 Tax=Mesorhizobium plurifarium TaxID=69974 RepID=A0A090FTD1_MESPL|nr:hypothetical protein MPL3356_40520 [Mesorhizobium plurifarium]CDX48917.1 hypothetical protein MPL3365_10108 [Mesorhizobium plurifarium]
MAATGTLRKNIDGSQPDVRFGWTFRPLFEIPAPVGARKRLKPPGVPRGLDSCLFWPRLF